MPFQRNNNTDKGTVGTPIGISVWLKMSELNTNDVLLKKFRNLNGFPFKVSIFHRYPTAVFFYELPPVLRKSYFLKEMRRSKGFGGFDGLVLGNLAEIFNFSVVVNEANDPTYGYGGQGATNDTFTGK